MAAHSTTLGDPFCDVARIPEVRFDWLIVSEVDRDYAGFLYWHFGDKPFFAPHVQKFAHIREIQVLDKFQRKVVGRSLMTYALGRLRKLGVNEVFLATRETNNVARHLYESLGFKEFRKQIHYSLRIDNSISQVGHAQTGTDQ